MLTQFTIDISFTTINRFLRMNHLSIYVYEIKHSSLLIYGADIRKYIKVANPEIWRGNVSHFLLQKLIGLLGHLDENRLRSKNWKTDTDLNFIMECHKTNIEIGTSLSILGNCYSPSFQDRLNNLKSSSSPILTQIYSNFTGILEDIEKSTKIKLAPKKSDFQNNARNLWLKSRNNLISLINYHIFGNIAFSTAFDPSYQILYKINDYWDDFLKLNSLYIPKLYPFSTLLLYINRISLKLYLNLMCKKSKFGGHWFLLYPNLIIYSLGYRIIQSIDDRGNIISRNILGAASMLARFMDIKWQTSDFTNKGNLFFAVRTAFLEFDKSYYGPR
ncbi:MAG: hypothetical protein ACFFG0_35485 [Candidatus Thorarchaeota archaeon]